MTITLATLWTSFIILLHSSCSGNAERHHNHSEGFLPITVLETNQPDIYPLADQACQAEHTNHNSLILGPARLSLWQNGRLTTSDLTLDPLVLEANPLRSRQVRRVLYGTHHRRDCDASKASYPACVGPDGKPSTWTVVNTGAPIRVCSSPFDPGRKTLEHLAVTAVMVIEKTANNLRNLLPNLPQVTPLEVHGMPNFETRWSPWTHNLERGHHLSHLTENLAYFAGDSTTTPFIAIFPKSKAASLSTNLWESEFVIAHEFAHHVERSIGLDLNGKDPSMLQIATSEAFADLLAFASQGASSHTIKGIPCVGDDRSVESSSFANGRAKRLDKELITLMHEKDGSNPGNMFLNCQGVLPQSSHGVGAVLAHWIYQFAKLTPVYQDHPEKAVARLTLSWLQHVRQGVGQNKPEELTSIARSLESAVTDQYIDNPNELTDSVRRLLCQKMAEGFSGLGHMQWFARTDC